VGFYTLLRGGFCIFINSDFLLLHKDALLKKGKKTKGLLKNFLLANKLSFSALFLLILKQGVKGLGAFTKNLIIF